MSDKQFSGVIPILQMPFNNEGAIDYGDLGKEINWCIDVGVKGLGIALGTEIMTLLDIERDQILKFVDN